MDASYEGLSRGFALPRVRQIGIVVRDASKAAEYYSRTFGIGPWFRPKLSGEQHFLKGERPIKPDLEIAIAYAGKIQYEIIEHKGGDPTIYNEHLTKHGEGLHHLGFYVNDFDKRLSAYKERGIRVLQSGALTSGGIAGGSVTNYAYLDTTAVGGVILEIIETRFLTMNIQMSRFWFELGALLGDVEKIRT
jgi:catechol 2,3-dioxygenase-like lactoylglutathione lyase family enzyme